MPHGFGAGDGKWILDFDRWLIEIFPQFSLLHLTSHGRVLSSLIGLHDSVKDQLELVNLGEM
jgi:hypothetical protein